MIHCRAKMVDGTPITFVWLPEVMVTGDQHPGTAPLFCIRNECSGEGFFVRDECYAYWGGEPHRKKSMELALERSGVDTETVERADGSVFTDAGGHWDGTTYKGRVFVGRWEKVFHPAVSSPPADPAPGTNATELEMRGLKKMLLAERRMTEELTKRLEARADPTAEMMLAGKEEATRCWIEQTAITESISRVWRAMEKVRR